MQYTKPTKAGDIKREWHLIDAKGKVLGRAATQIAEALMGRQKPYFVRYLDMGDYVVVINAAHAKVTGNKAQDKIYTRYSGYPGGLKKEKFKDLLQRKPEEVLKRAVSGMLPKNKLRKKFLRRLYIYPYDKHPYQDKVTYYA